MQTNEPEPENVPSSPEGETIPSPSGDPAPDGTPPAAGKRHIDMPSVEMLERLHTFPGMYMFKAIGRGDDGFPARLIAAVREELAEAEDPPFRIRHTGSGRHVSVTIEPTVQSVTQVLAIYRRICDTEGLVMVW